MVDAVREAEGMSFIAHPLIGLISGSVHGPRARLCDVGVCRIGRLVCRHHPLDERDDLEDFWQLEDHGYEWLEDEPAPAAEAQ